MATYYVDASGGNDSNDGLTTGAPFLTLAKCVAVAAAGDTFNLKGTFRESADFTGKGDNITIQQWAGQTAAWIRGDTVVSSFTVDGGGQCYNKTITTGLAVYAVTANWDSQVDAYGQHYGHLTKAASLAACKTTDNSWYYDSGTGVLSVRIGANLNPSGYTVTYCGVASATVGRNGLSIGGAATVPAHGIVIKNLTFAMWCYLPAGWGYGLQLLSCNNSLADGNTYYDCGYHAQGILGYNGVPVRNVWERNASSFGIAAAGDSAYVVYADTGGVDVDSGFENCYCLLSPYLGMDGLPIAMSGVTTASVIGFACHTGGAMNISRFRAKNCLVYTRTVHASMTNRMGSYVVKHTTAPSNRLVANTYGAWLDRCDTINGVKSVWVDSGAWTNSRLDFSQSGSTSAAVLSNGCVLGDASSNNADAWMLWSACEIVTDLNVGANPAAVFNCRGNTSTSKKTHIININCSIINKSLATDAQIRTFFNHILTASPDIYARGTIYMHRALGTGANHNNLTYGNTSVTPELIDFKNCWYINMDTDRYTSGTTYNDKTEFDDIDTGGVFEAGTNPFRDPSGTGPLELNAYGKSMTAFVLPNCTEGINRRAYSKNYGAYQYGFKATTIPPL